MKHTLRFSHFAFSFMLCGLFGSCITFVFSLFTTIESDWLGFDLLGFFVVSVMLSGFQQFFMHLILLIHHHSGRMHASVETTAYFDKLFYICLGTGLFLSGSFSFLLFVSFKTGFPIQSFIAFMLSSAIPAAVLTRFYKKELHNLSQHY